MEIAGHTTGEEQHAFESFCDAYTIFAPVLPVSTQFDVIKEGIVHGSHPFRWFPSRFVAERPQINSMILSFAVGVYDLPPFVQQLDLKFLLMSPLLLSHVTRLVAPTKTAAAPLQLDGKVIVVVERGF